jgi:hypothetical protein
VNIDIDEINNCGGGDCDVELSWNSIAGATSYEVCGFPGGCDITINPSFNDSIDHGDYTVTVNARSGTNVIATGTREIDVP